MYCDERKIYAIYTTYDTRRLFFLASVWFVRLYLYHHAYLVLDIFVLLYTLFWRRCYTIRQRQGKRRG